MTLKIISAEKIEFEGDVEQVTLPGALGSFQVLQNHAALLAALVPGTMSYRQGDELVERKIDGGVADVKNNVVNVCLY